MNRRMVVNNHQDANHYVLNPEGPGNWIAVVQCNGEMMTTEQHSLIHLLAAAPVLLAALTKIHHQARAGMGTLDESGTAVGVEDFEFIEGAAWAAISQASPPVAKPKADLWMVPMLVEVPVEAENQESAIAQIANRVPELATFLEHATSGGAFEHKPYVKTPVSNDVRLASDQELADILGEPE